MAYYEGLTIMLLLFLFILDSHCAEFDSMITSGELRCIAKEREALLKFKQGLIDEGRVLSSWGSEEDKKECCRWDRVDCNNETGHVIGLQLNQHNSVPLRGHVPLFHPKSMVLQLSNNMFQGTISSVCTITYDALLVLDLSNNQFLGELPNCWKNMRELLILNLANNKFSGGIPNSFGSLRLLQTLHLRNNNFSGELPSTLKRCQKLVMIDVGGNELTGNIPAWIGTHLTTLIVLNLGHNKFDSIPLEICYLTEIQILDLSRNSISGTIPSCFDNFTSLVQKDRTAESTIFEFQFGAYPFYVFTQYIDHTFVQWKGHETEYRKTLRLLKHIDLSSNRLVGSIPREFSHMRELISLNLSRNYLNGNIITNIGHMKMLESLDLSRNQFFGEIPISLAELHFLAVLNLSNNNLSGKIPSSTQLQGFNESTYVGNSELCGHPLMNCPEDGLNQSIIDYGKPDEAEEDDIITRGFIIASVFGFILGFWGVVGTLVIKNSWRNAYFNFFNKITNWLYVTTIIYFARLKRQLEG